MIEDVKKEVRNKRKDNSVRIIKEVKIICCRDCPFCEREFVRNICSLYDRKPIPHEVFYIPESKPEWCSIEFILVGS